MRRLFITTTISPMMIGTMGDRMLVKEVDKDFLDQKIADFRDRDTREIMPAVGHEITAPFIEAVTGISDLHARVNISLAPGDEVLAVIPAIRFTEAREFSQAEVAEAGMRIFHAVVVSPPWRE